MLPVVLAAGCGDDDGGGARDTGADVTTDVGLNACEFHDRVYADGQEFCGIDGCNGCKCNPDIGVSGVGCTVKGCFAQLGSPQSEYSGDCQRTMWHLADAARPTSLGLFADGSFRWIAIGDGDASGDLGLWQDSGSAVTLTPAPGRSDFAWPQSEAQTSLELARNGQALEVALAQTQSWEPGGQCPPCPSQDAGIADGSTADGESSDGGATDGGADASARMPCGNPFAFSRTAPFDCVW